MSDSTDIHDMRPADSRPFFWKLSYHFVVTLCYVLSGLIALSLWMRDQREMQANILALARERGQMAFDLIELTRLWNSNHGGIYVKVTPQTEPNPYLDHPERDLTTTTGEQLTMINPAYMTRQIAELATRGEGRHDIRFHITSLNPIRPDNQADAWEREALKKFETGSAEYLAEFGSDATAATTDQGKARFRYMAPLLVKAGCLNCHAKQGYKLGDVRGGISVSMEAEHLRHVAAERRRTTALTYGALFVLLGILTHGLVWNFRRYDLQMRDIQRQQQHLIELRTRDLAQSEARYRTIFNTATEGIVVTDADGVIQQVNPAYSAISLYSADEVIGKTPSVLRSGHHPVEFYQAMWDSLLRSGAWEGEIWNRRKDGELFVALLSISRVALTNGMPVPANAAAAAGYVGTFIDITERKELEESMRYKAHHDALTDLPNRSLFTDRLHNAFSLALRHNRQLALLSIDLDKFKEVNDRFGHPAGDELLKDVAQRLQLCVREADTVARFGGDEFAVLLTEVAGEAEVASVAQRIVSALHEPFTLTAGVGEVSASVGIALFPDHAHSLEELQQQADKALYAAKQGGRNAYRFSSRAMDLPAHDVTDASDGTA